MTVTLLEVVAAAQKHAAALPGELAGYLLLATADQVAGAPRCPSMGDVVLGEDGSVRVIGGAAATDREAESRLRELFAFTLGRSAPVTVALTRVAQRPESGSVRGLIQELEAALIPLNRSASRRALSRLCRETLRAAARGALADLASLAAAAEQRDPRKSPEPVAPPALVVPVASARVEASAEPELDIPISVSDAPSSVSVAAPPSVATSSPPRVETPAPQDISEGSALESLLTAPTPAPSSSAAVTPVLRAAASEAPQACAVREESTRPEPVIVRASQRPGPNVAAPDASLTPLLGSLAEPECVPVEVVRELPEVALVVGDATERMPEVDEALECTPPPIVQQQPEAEAAPEQLEADAAPAVVEVWPCDGFISWESCAPPPVKATASVSAADAEAQAVDAAWDEVALEVERAFETMQADDRSGVAHEPVLAACAVLELESLTLTEPGGVVAERPPAPTPAKTPSMAPQPVWAPARFLPRKSDVDALLRGFCVADTRDERELCRELSEIAGVEAGSSA
ncbi:MAG TPA: hypothetical protein VI072_35665 [Polyangiaceae bacterium]